MAGGKKHRSRESVEATVEEEEKRREPQAEEAEQSTGSDGSSEGDYSGENEEVDDRFVADDRFSAGSGTEAMEDDSVQSEEGSEEDDEAQAKAIEKQKRKMRRDAEKFRDREMRKGVIYLSRIPPHMKPEKIRHLLGQYGDVLRIFLQPESEFSSQLMKHSHTPTHSHRSHSHSRTLTLTHTPSSYFCTPPLEWLVETVAMQRFISCASYCCAYLPVVLHLG